MQDITANGAVFCQASALDHTALALGGVLLKC
jgi:hypothetical protein